MEQLISGAEAPIDVTMDNFMAEVIDASATTPTVVQFWAPWCGPASSLDRCWRRLSAAAAAGAHGRVNIDENSRSRSDACSRCQRSMALSMASRWTGLPARSPINGAAVFDKLAGMGGAGADAAAMLEAAEAALAGGDHETAMMQFQQVMSVMPESVPALAGVVRCLTAAAMWPARARCDQLNEDYLNDPAMKTASPLSSLRRRRRIRR